CRLPRVAVRPAFVRPSLLDSLRGRHRRHRSLRDVDHSSGRHRAVSVARLRRRRGTDQGGQMRIKLTSVLVDDQDKALHFYPTVLGFEKKTEIPLGEHRWLTVVSPDDPDGTELALEPDVHPAAKPFKAALASDGIPFASFAVDDVHKEYERLRALGVEFTQD